MDFKNQFGRRNLSAYDRSILALKLKPIIAEKAKEKQAEYHGNQYQSAVPQIFGEVQTTTPQEKKKRTEHKNETDAQIAEKAGVSRETIRKVEKIEAKATPEVKEALRSGEISINAAKAKEQQGTRTDLNIVKNSCQSSEDLPPPKPVREQKTDYQVAKAAGVSDNTIAKVEKIEQQATPEVKAAKAKENQEQGINQYSLCQKSDKPSIDTRQEVAKAVVAALPLRPFKSLIAVPLETALDPYAEKSLFSAGI